MAKTLIIKGADFSGHYVEQVSFSDVPCTGVSLNKSTTTLENTTSTETLIATVTPANTTDNIIWLSSNNDIVSVNNGVISAVGLGTATITVQCGDFSATCEVTCEGVVDFKYSIGAWIGLANNNNDYITVSDTSANNAFSIGASAGTYHATRQETDDGWLYPIIIPKNAAVIKARCLTQYYGVQAIYFLDSTDHSTNYTEAAKYTGAKVSGSSTGWGDKTYDGVACWGNDIALPSEDYDSCVILFKQQGSATVAEIDAQKTHIWFE